MLLGEGGDWSEGFVHTEEVHYNQATSSTLQQGVTGQLLAEPQASVSSRLNKALNDCAEACGMNLSWFTQQASYC